MRRTDPRFGRRGRGGCQAGPCARPHLGWWTRRRLWRCRRRLRRSSLAFTFRLSVTGLPTSCGGTWRLKLPTFVSWLGLSRLAALAVGLGRRIVPISPQHTDETPAQMATRGLRGSGRRRSLPPERRPSSSSRQATTPRRSGCFQTNISSRRLGPRSNSH